MKIELTERLIAKQDKDIIIDSLIMQIRSLEDVIEAANTVANNCYCERDKLKEEIEKLVDSNGHYLNEISTLKHQIQEFKDKEEDRATLKMTMEGIETEIKEKRKYTRKV